MIYIIVSLFAVSIGGVETLLICKGFDRPIKHSYLLARALFAILGMAIFLLGMCFHLRSWPYATFFSTLFCILGAQIGLWSIGISEEIIGNQPNIEGVREFGSPLDIIFESKLSITYAFIFIIMIVLAISTVQNLPQIGYRPRTSSDSSGFIQQVRAE